MAIELKTLRETVEENAAIRLVQRLQPVGGPGDKIFPPTYPGERHNDPARHVFETRRINGNGVQCVLLDSVQSQANRLEEALLTAMRAGEITVPHIVVDFRGQQHDGMDLSDLGEITSLDAPHRVFDAIIRDSEEGGTRFTETEHFRQLHRTKPTNATYIFRLSPTSLVFGAWNSTGEGGGIGARFTRCIVSEIIGIGTEKGQKGAVRIDPLGIRREVEVVGGRLDWEPAGDEERGKRPSEINHSNIISNLVDGGVTVDYALHTAVISCTGLRRLRFPGMDDETAGRTVLAALALVALTGQDRAGYALRSRCDLVCEAKAPFEIVRPDGSVETFQVGFDDAVKILKESINTAKTTGFPWNEEPLRLTPQQRLVELVALSRARTLAGEAESDDGND